MDEIPNPVRVLFVEDAPMEVELASRHLRKEGLKLELQRVETEGELRQALQAFDPHLILSDFSLPQFDGLSALRIAQEVASEVPFIFLSGTIGEERAITALRSGAVDYIIKGNLARLAPAVRRALTESVNRAAQREQADQIARLNRVLRMLSAVNGLALRIGSRADLLAEACRCAVEVGGYDSALTLLKGSSEGTTSVSGEITAPTRPEAGARLRDAAMQQSGRCRELIEAAMSTGTDRHYRDENGTLLILPLLVDRTAIGALMLASPDTTPPGDEELSMLRELAGNLSFGLQYQQTDSRMRFLSHFDVQTALARRPLFCQRVQRALAAATLSGQSHAVAVIDIERLGAINTSFGRRLGDLLLQHVADRLKSRFPSEDIAHFGGGTFAVLLDPSGPADRQLEQLQGQIRHHAAAIFGVPFELEGRAIPVSARVGVALNPDAVHDAGIVLQNAEDALQEARSSGQKQVYHRADRPLSAATHLDLEHRLHRALQRREFVLHYQPKVNVITRRIEGVEALIRWMDPEKGLVSPGHFLPVLESSGLIVDVGQWVIEQAARDCREWVRAGLQPMRIAVNIAPVQLRQPDFVPVFIESASACTAERGGLDIEITESALQDNCGEDIRALERLRQHRIRVAIDDFGIGYSSLSRLSMLPIDTLKIDRSFVSALGTPRGDTLVRIIIAMAKAFQMTTVAEGVETQEQLAFLASESCDQVQGYFIGKPAPIQQYAELVGHAVVGGGDAVRRIG
ncbi:MAG: GGDEF domain-containing response regulator [Steroidobacteraceae bacterium]